MEFASAPPYHNCMKRNMLIFIATVIIAAALVLVPSMFIGEEETGETRTSSVNEIKVQR
jgi:hypothetical protein